MLQQALEGTDCVTVGDEQIAAVVGCQEAQTRQHWQVLFVLISSNSRRVNVGASFKSIQPFNLPNTVKRE